MEMTHQMPALPHRFAAHAASGMRDAVSAVDASIGGTVSPAPPNAPSSTISEHTTSCEIAAMRKYETDSTITAGSLVNSDAN